MYRSHGEHDTGSTLDVGSLPCVRTYKRQYNSANELGYQIQLGSKLYPEMRTTSNAEAWYYLSKTLKHQNTNEHGFQITPDAYFNHEFSLTPTGKPITLKDEKKNNIYKMNYSEVKKFDVGSKLHARFPGQQKFKAYKPLLAELIDSVENYVKLNRLPKPDYNIETKLIRKGDGEFQPNPEEYVEIIMDIIKQKKLEKRVIIQSFDIRSLQYVHEKYPKMRTSLGIDEKVDFEDNIDMKVAAEDTQWMKEAAAYVKERITPGSRYKLKKFIDDEKLN